MDTERLLQTNSSGHKTNDKIQVDFINVYLFYKNKRENITIVGLFQIGYTEYKRTFVSPKNLNMTFQKYTHCINIRYMAETDV